MVLAIFPDSNRRTGKPRPALVIQADNLATIDDRVIDRVIGVWSDMTAVDPALRHTLGI